MATTRKSVTEADVQALKKLYDTLDEFHQSIKEQAQAANSSGDLIIRKQFEKYLSGTSKDLANLHERIRRADMALYRKETKALAEKLEQDASDNAS